MLAKSDEDVRIVVQLPRVGYGRDEQGSNLTLKGLLRLLVIHQVSLAGFFADMPARRAAAPATLALQVFSATECQILVKPTP